MRPIRFRAWDKKDNRMFTIADVGSLEGFFAHVENDEETYIVMQWTGLSDCNGNDIYEGDLVTSKKYWDFPLVVEIIDAINCEPFMYFMSGDDFEVIGNIHEHPHLPGYKE